MTKSRNFKASGRVTGIPGPVRVATDGAADQARAARAFLATSGHWGTEGYAYTARIGGTHRVAVSEMGAVHLALSRIYRDLPGAAVTVYVDSVEALQWMRSWQAGRTDLPTGYPTTRKQGRPSTLVRLQALLRTHRAVNFRYVAAHTGDPLNEAADSLAKLALRASRGGIDSSTAMQLPARWAVRRLGDLQRIHH